MAAVTEREQAPFTPVADPAPLGLAAFALTTFLLSGHNASFIPDGIWVGAALFYGGLIQLFAGMWEFRNRNVFGATAFSTYGGFWLALGIFVVLLTGSKGFAGLLKGADVDNSLAWFLIAFAIFNTYMLLMSLALNTAVFAVFLTLEITEIVLFIGNFAGSSGTVKIGGVIGVITAVAAWYTSAAGVSASIAGNRLRLPVGPALLPPTAPAVRANA